MEAFVKSLFLCFTMTTGLIVESSRSSNRNQRRRWRRRATAAAALVSGVAVIAVTTSSRLSSHFAASSSSVTPVMTSLYVLDNVNDFCASIERHKSISRGAEERALESFISRICFLFAAAMLKKTILSFSLVPFLPQFHPHH